MICSISGGSLTYRRAIRAVAQGQPQLVGDRPQILVEPVEQRVGGDRLDLRRDDAGLEPRDIEQPAEQPFERLDVGPDVADDRPRLDRQIEGRECPREQAEGVERLAQVVTGGGEELRLGEARRLGRGARRDGDFGLGAQPVEQLDVLEPDADPGLDGSRLQPPHQQQDAGISDRRGGEDAVVGSGERRQPDDDEGEDDRDEAEQRRRVVGEARDRSTGDDDEAAHRHRDRQRVAFVREQEHRRPPDKGDAGLVHRVVSRPIGREIVGRNARGVALEHPEMAVDLRRHLGCRPQRDDRHRLWVSAVATTNSSVVFSAKMLLRA